MDAGGLGDCAGCRKQAADDKLAEQQLVINHRKRRRTDREAGGGGGGADGGAGDPAVQVSVSAVPLACSRLAAAVGETLPAPGQSRCLRQLAVGL